jgi:hypothetical protein
MKAVKKQTAWKRSVFWSLESFLLNQRLKLNFQDFVKVIQH